MVASGSGKTVVFQLDRIEFDLAKRFCCYGLPDIINRTLFFPIIIMVKNEVENREINEFMYSSMYTCVVFE